MAVPRLTDLPLPIPVPLFIGARSSDFPWPFFGARYIGGNELADLLPADPTGRTDMRRRVELTRERLAEIARLGRWATPALVEAILAAALELPSAPATAVAHGDLHLRHLLVDRDRTPTGVLDWGDICRADPSIDLSLYWSLLSRAGR